MSLAANINSIFLTKPTAQKALSAFETLKKLGLQSQVCSVFQSLLEAGLEKDTNVWNVALEQLGNVKGEHYYRLDELIGEMRLIGPRPNSKSYSVAIRYHVDGGRMDIAASYVEQVNLQKLNPRDKYIMDALEHYRLAERKKKLKGQLLPW